MSENMSVSFTCDWLSATSHNPGRAKRFLNDLGFGTYLTDVERSNLRGYNMTREVESGMIVAWSSVNDKQGIHVQLSGSVLRYYSTIGVEWKQIIELMKQHGFRTSRVDLAIDLIDSGLTQADLSRKTLLPYKGKGRTPKMLPMGTVEDGWTLYVGSRSSDKFLRIYDKGKEQGDADTDYIRVELECKGEVAHAIGWEFAELEQSACVEMAQTLIRNHCNFDIPAWETALLSRDVNLSIPQGKQKDTFGWLIKVCAPALAKEIEKRPKSPVIDEFWNALRRELRERGIDA